MDPRTGEPEQSERVDAEPNATETTVALPRAQRPPRDPLALTPELGTGTGTGGTARIVRIVAGEYLLTVNPVDGSEVGICPPADRPVPVRRTEEQRGRWQAACRPALPPGPTVPALLLLEREEERERLTRLLSRGRSVRVIGPSGSGRSALLDTVAAACASLAPDGVVRLSGYRRTALDLLQDLFTTVYEAEGFRPDRPQLLGLLHEVGAIVVIDDLEFGGAALEELLGAAPECAFLMSVTPDVAVPLADSLVEEVFLPGLTRVACLELLEWAVERPLEEEEVAWAADLWFESEGLPLRFTQAGALLRQRDALRAPQIDIEDVWDDPARHDDPSADSSYAGSPEHHVPLPSLAESAAPAELLASRLSPAARETLRFAVALGRECPHQSHLPALVGDTHGDAALGELIACGLVQPVAAHYRLAEGVRRQLAAGLAVDVADGDGGQAHTAAQHYAWWAGHPSVTADRVAAESEAILAALSGCRDTGHNSSAVLLARTAAPALAAGLHWSAWERALRVGQDAARQAGEVAEEAYFHHELGVLALLTGNLDRARTELEASIAMRGALADRQGTVVGRRTLALVVDRSGGLGSPGAPVGPHGSMPGDDATTAASGIPVATARRQTSATTVIGRKIVEAMPAAMSAHPVTRRIARGRRNYAAAAAGVLLVAVLGTVLTLGATAGGTNENIPVQVKPVETARQGETDGGLTPDPSSPGDMTWTPAESAIGSATSDAETTDTRSPTASPSASASASPFPTTESPTASPRPSSSGPRTPRPTTTPPTTQPTTSPPPPPTTTSPTPTSPTPTDIETSASGPTATTPTDTVGASDSGTPSEAESAPIA